jgi:hypothetical protein
MSLANSGGEDNVKSTAPSGSPHPNNESAGGRAKVPFPQADRKAVEVFVDSLFRHASRDSLINLRAFHDLRDNEPPLFIEAVRVGAPNCIERICARIHDAAIHEEPHVFCPPVCTFKEAGSAKTENLADGIALSVECDSAPYAARERLLEILGPATAVVASGGTWVNPEGKLERMLHLHWRLAEPARDVADHERLREARDLAAEIVGADASAKSVVHPLRWPGSWHRKNPRLPRLAELKANPDVEIDLGTKTWTVPAARMKAAKEHKVPLMLQLTSLLDQSGF